MTARFRFESLLNYRTSLREQCRQLLGQAIALENSLDRQIEQTTQLRADQTSQLRQIAEHPQLDIDAARSRQLYSTVLAGEILKLKHQRELAGKQTAAARQALVEADKRVRVLERLQERQQAARQLAEQRAIQHQLEEAWQGARLSREQS